MANRLTNWAGLLGGICYAALQLSKEFQLELDGCVKAAAVLTAAACIGIIGYFTGKGGKDEKG